MTPDSRLLAPQKDFCFFNRHLFQLYSPYSPSLTDVVFYHDFCFLNGKAKLFHQRKLSDYKSHELHRKFSVFLSLSENMIAVNRRLHRC
jgi:uncharacterized protein YwgA